MSTPSEHPTRPTGRPPEPSNPDAPTTEAAPVCKPSPAPSTPKLAYSEVANPPPPRTEMIVRGAARIQPPPQTPRGPQPAPRPRPAPQPRPHRAPQPPSPADTVLCSALPSVPSVPPTPPAQPPTHNARPRLTGPEWVAAAAMVLLILAVVLGLALN